MHRISDCFNEFSSKGFILSTLAFLFLHSSIAGNIRSADAYTCRPMEQLKGEKLQEWLARRLTQPWHGHQAISAELGNDAIDNIRENWTQLSFPVRLGVLFSLVDVKMEQQKHFQEIKQNVTTTDTRPMEEKKALP